jgi:hypothetical protein
VLRRPPAHSELASSRCVMSSLRIATEGDLPLVRDERHSNSPRSATESRLRGFSARSGEIARACGFICVTRGTGEKYFPAVRAQTRPKSLLASEAVPSMPALDGIDSTTAWPKCEELIEREPPRRAPRLLLGRSGAEGDRSVWPRPLQIASIEAFGEPAVDFQRASCAPRCSLRLQFQF